MNRYVVMVDAGYLLRQSIEIVSQRASKRRAELEISDPAGLVNCLVSKSTQLLSLQEKELLRVYWYDGVNAGGLTTQQRSLVEVDDVQFRAGTVNAAKQQKGVDSLIVTDLIELTSHHAMCDAILVTGDSDLAIGIEVAQRRGVRIAVLGVEDLALGVSHHQSFEITSRADRVGCLGGAELTPFLRYVPSAVVVPIRNQGAAAANSAPLPAPTTAPAAPNAPPLTRPAVPVTQETRDRILAAVEAFTATHQSDLAATIDVQTSRISAPTDRALIHAVYAQLNQGALTNPEKVMARNLFRKALEQKSSP